ncbi:histidine phosphatase family protein [Bacillus sp. JJ1609]|uniref:histidine phosphatase family protein n=1 Tax=Bacillus sp. JJ1609 TaxID=3122977 RepID=UPI002FFFBB84
MQTFIYLVRHGDSPKTGENERTRGLTEKGQRDAKQITELLIEEEIEIFASSPYSRAILTIQELAELSGKKVLPFEDLKERVFSGGDKRLSDEELFPLLERSFADPDYAVPGGESNKDCQERAIRVLYDILVRCQGRKVAIGTHGAVMTLMMAYFDSRFNLDFLHQLSKPDVYRMTLEGEKLVEFNRMWVR